MILTRQNVFIYLLGQGNLVDLVFGCHAQSCHEHPNPDLSRRLCRVSADHAQERRCRVEDGHIFSFPDHAKWFPKVLVPIYTSHSV